MQRAKFLGGAAKVSDLDRLNLEDLPRIAFAGRSNVGKSTLLNSLTGTKIAKVSASPGKTREMNFFRWGLTRAPEDACILVDLPGYGYAKVGTQLRQQWGQEITVWLQSDSLLKLVVVLADGRYGFMASDIELIEFLQAYDIPFLVVFTKMDKWKSANQRKKAERELYKVAQKLGVSDYVFVSSQQKESVSRLLTVLRERLC